MKRIFSASVALIIVLALAIIPVSAIDEATLIPEGADWSTEPAGGYDITVTVKDGATVFSATDSWPAANCRYTEAQIVRTNIDGYSLVYDFSVDKGQTNINFSFTDGFGNSDGYSFANSTLGDVNYDSGSGDLYAGDYKGSVKLSDLVNSNMFLGDKAFPSNMITENNEIIFTGIQVFSVSGATVTVRELKIVPTDKVGETDTETSESTENSENTENSETVNESEEVSAEESKTEASENVTESETISETATESVTEENSEANETETNDSFGIWLWVIIGGTIVIVLVVVIVVLKKKK